MADENESPELEETPIEALDVTREDVFNIADVSADSEVVTFASVEAPCPMVTAPSTRKPAWSTIVRSPSPASDTSMSPRRLMVGGSTGAK